MSSQPLRLPSVRPRAFSEGDLHEEATAMECIHCHCEGFSITVRRTFVEVSSRFFEEDACAQRSEASEESTCPSNGAATPHSEASQAESADWRPPSSSSFGAPVMMMPMCFFPVPVAVPVAVSLPVLPPALPPSPIADEATTLLIKNLGDALTGKLLARLLTNEGFAGCFDFLYVPRNLQTKRAFGFAFVNFTCHDVAVRALSLLHGRRQPGLVASDKDALEARWSDVNQGFEAQVARYRNSPLMHETVAQEFKPLVFEDGVEQPFPAPTEEISLPAAKASRRERQIRARARRVAAGLGRTHE